MSKIKKFLYSLINRCECGGKIVSWSMRKAYCDRCDKIYNKNI